MKTPLVYILHSGQLFGTERMALATLAALSDRFEPCVLAPAGPVHSEAVRMGMRSEILRGPASMFALVSREVWRDRATSFMSTGVSQALVVSVMQRLLGARGTHLHIVHGGTDERLSYGRKRLLSGLGIRFVAVSEFVAQRLKAHGVDPQAITVIANFLHGKTTASRPAFERDGVRRVVMLSRLDRIKRVGLLFDALDRDPSLQAMQFDVYGSGEEADVLAQRAAKYPCVHLHGFVLDAASRLGQADLLLHTCPEEPFGLVMLEAFSAGVPVLVPNAGGAACIVQSGVNGFHFSANSAASLARQLHVLMKAPKDVLNGAAAGGKRSLHSQYRPDALVGDYGRLLEA